MNLLDYGSSSDDDKEDTDKPASPAQIKKKLILPSASDLLGTKTTVSSSATSAVVTSPLTTKATTASVSLAATKVTSTSSVGKANVASSSTRLKPPQLTRPNIITEDYKLWNKKSKNTTANGKGDLKRNSTEGESPSKKKQMRKEE